jgi:predicted Zn-dependent protease
MRKLIYCFLAICFLFSTTAVWGQWGNAPASPPGFGGGSPFGGGASSADSAFSSMNQAFNKAENPINLEEDYYLGRAVAANILSMPSYRLYTANPKLTAYLNLICQTLVINTPDTSTFNGYQVAILDSRQYNAFATPAGHILITRGLIEAAPSEDALAALIAHEIAHIQLRHAAEIINEMALSNELDSIAKQAAALSGNSAGAQKALAMRNSVAPIVDAMIKNGFSRDQEYAADAKALDILNAAGYNARALVDMLLVLQNVQSSQSGGFNSTHPSPRDRITRVNQKTIPINNTQSFRQPPRFFVK